MKHKASQPALPAETAKPTPEYSKPKGNEFIEKGAETPSKPPREGTERPDRGARNTPIGNYGNFPIGKAYAQPSGGSRAAPEVVQPQTSGGRMSVPEDLHGRNPDRSNSRGND